MTREYPPEVYGGAGVHVTELTRFMREIDGVDVDVHCMGAPRDEANVYAHGVDPELENANSALKTLSTGLRMANAADNLDVVHSHTWYAGLGGHLTGKLYGIPHVATAHSLEPHRPGSVSSSAADTMSPPGARRTRWKTPTPLLLCRPE